MKKITNKNILPGLAVLALSLFFSCGGEKRKPDILLITIDTLRRDHLGAYGYPRETSPFIDRLAREGVVFKHAVTPIPLTTGSHASILTSLHPLTHNVTLNGAKLGMEVKTLAEVLKENGYYTIGTVAVGVLARDKNFGQGFDSFSDRWKKEEGLNPKFPLAERTAPSVNRSLFKQIDEYCTQPHRKPFFIWVHYYDPHSPYYDHPGIAFQTKIKEGSPPGVKKYDKEIRYTDEHIEKLFDYLEKKKLTRRLITCITADHGEQFGEHGYTYGHVDFYTENTYVPLIFNGYRVPEDKVIDTYTSTMDIGVTLLAMAGSKFEYPTEGVDLFPLMKKNSRLKDRKFLIIDSPKYTRSLQLLGNPYAYILNFDYHYKYWFVSYRQQNPVPENLFKPIPKDTIETKGLKMFIPLPTTSNQGLNYMIVRADIPRNEGLTFEIMIKPFLLTNKVKIPETPGKNVPMEIIYPLTVLDDLRLILYLQGKTCPENIRYAVIPANELPANLTFSEKIENRFFKSFKSLRKDKRTNEFYDLAADLEMTKNQSAIEKFKPTLIQFHKLIYTVFQYYTQKKDRLFSGKTVQGQLTAEDKKMLETLGYL